MNAFETQIQRDCGLDLYASDLETLQVNLGFKCNLSCHHCHHACGPDRTEVATAGSPQGAVRAQATGAEGRRPARDRSDGRREPIRDHDGSARPSRAALPGQVRAAPSV